MSTDQFRMYYIIAVSLHHI